MSRMDRGSRGQDQGGGNGVFIQSGTVKSISINDLFDKKDGNSMHYKVTIEVKKYESEETYEKNLLMVGKMWKGGKIPTHIENMMYSLGVETGKVPDAEIDDFLDNCLLGKNIEKIVVGKEIKYVDYRSNKTYEADGKTKYSTKTWNGSQPFKDEKGKSWKAIDTFDIATDNGVIYKAFMVSVAVDNEYIGYQAEDDLAEESGNDASNYDAGATGSEDKPNDDLLI